MSANDNLLIPVIKKVRFLMTESRQQRSSGLSFRIYHRYRQPGSDCAAGEEVLAIFLVCRGREFYIPLSLGMRLLFDFLAHSHIPQSASQIHAAMKIDQFYSKHGANAMRGKDLLRRISRSAIKVYVARIRHALELTLKDAHLQIDPRSILVSQETVSNETNYRLKGKVEWVHTDLP